VVRRPPNSDRSSRRAGRPATTLIRRCLVLSALVGLTARSFAPSISRAAASASTASSAAASTALTWTFRPGCARDIAVGHLTAPGNNPPTVLVIGCNPVHGGYGIYQWNGTGWVPLPGGAVSIGASADAGEPWVTNDAGQIYLWLGGGLGAVSRLCP
jgi:hypothetical protein